MNISNELFLKNVINRINTRSLIRVHAETFAEDLYTYEITLIAYRRVSKKVKSYLACVRFRRLQKRNLHFPDGVSSADGSSARQKQPETSPLTMLSLAVFQVENCKIEKKKNDYFYRYFHF